MSAQRKVSAEEARSVGEKVALTHLNEFADYYVRLRKMEAEAEARSEG